MLELGSLHNVVYLSGVLVRCPAGLLTPSAIVIDPSDHVVAFAVRLKTPTEQMAELPEAVQAVLIGVAANKSIATGEPVDVQRLLEEDEAS